MADKLIFAQTFEGLLRALGPRLDARMADELRKAGIDPAAELKPAYPLSVFQQMIRLVGEAVAPDQPADAQTFAAGRAFMDGYAQTMVGRAMLGMMRVIGPRRSLERLSRQFRTGNNFSETTLRELGDGEYELWVNQVSLPGFYRGIITAGLERAGAKDVTVDLATHADTAATFRIRWK